MLINTNQLALVMIKNRYGCPILCKSASRSITGKLFTVESNHFQWHHFLFFFQNVIDCTELPPKCMTKSSAIKKQKIFIFLFFIEESNKVYPNSNNIVLDLTWLFNYQTRNPELHLANCHSQVSIGLLGFHFLLIRCLSCSNNLFKK